MGLEKNAEESYREVPDKFAEPSADYQLSVQEQVVRAAALLADITITLPPVAEARGKWYSIIMTADDNNVIVADHDDSEYWPGDITLAGAGDRLLLFSDGRCWLSFFSTGNAPS